MTYVPDPAPADDELFSLLRRAFADPGQFCKRIRWQDNTGIAKWEYEPITAWGARVAGRYVRPSSPDIYRRVPLQHSPVSRHGTQDRGRVVDVAEAIERVGAGP